MSRWRAGGAALLAVVMLILGAGVAAAQVPQPTPAVGSLAGTVLAESGAAIPGAVVSIQGSSLTATTDDTGRFRIDRVPPGKVTVTVKAPGYFEGVIEAVEIVSRETAIAGATLQPTPMFLERVQVSATKVPLSLGSLPAQASIVDRIDIERRGDQTLTEAVANTPGAVVSTQYGLFESIALRGLPRGDPEFTNTLLLIDGIPQTLSNNGARVDALTINDTSNIEIVRGPNSALYGRTAIGGLVSLRTADPTPDHQQNIEFTAGELGSVKGIFRAAGPMLDWGGYYFSLAQERDGGFYEDLTTDDFAVGNKALFAKIAFRGGEKWAGSISVNRVVADSSTPTNEPVIDGQLLHNLDPTFDRLTNFNLPGRNYRHSEGRFTVNVGWQMTQAIKLTGLLGYRNVQQHFVEDGDFIAGPFDLENKMVTQYPFTQPTDEDIFYEELRFEMSPKLLRQTKDSLIFGVSHEGNDGSQTFTDISVGEAFSGWPISYSNPVFPDRSSWIQTTSSKTYHFNTTGLFAQYTMEPNARTTVTAAGRFDHLGMDNTTANVTSEDSFNAFSPKANATFRLTGDSSGERPTVNVYGAYSHAFVPPRRPSSLTPADVEAQLVPIDIDNVEGGVKASVLGGRMALDASYFYMIEDGVVLTTREGSLFRPTNAGEQKYRGLETGLQFAISPKVTVYANASFYHNRYGDFVIESEDGDEDITGNRLPISPDHVTNFGATILATPELDLTFDVKTMGEVMTDRSNSFSLDSYTLLDASASWHRGPLRITLSGHNLLNSEYYSNGDGESADPGRPRQILVTTSVRFR